MKNLKYILGILITSVLLFSSCTVNENYTFGTIVTPFNLTVTAEIVGVDTAHPNGDGSGTVNFTAIADNTINYKFTYNGYSGMTSTGTKTYNFGKTGTHIYNVTVEAIGDAGTSSLTTIAVEVLVLSKVPAEFLTMLTADNQKTWRIAKEIPGHLGVGPADSPDPIWWAANPNDKDGLGAYDDRFIFNVDGTFTHITNGTVFGHATPMSQDLGGNKGLTANGNGEYENYPYDDYNTNWEYSEPGGTEKLHLTGVGFMGFYVGGNHSYEILSRTANEIHLKTIGADGNGWFVKLVIE